MEQLDVTSAVASVVMTSEGGNVSVNVWSRYTHAGLYAAFRPAITHVDKYVTPMWYVIGFPANLLAATIWARRRMRPASGWYLAVLALCDLAFLLLQLVYELQSSWHVRLLKLPVLCEAFPVLFLTLQYLSPMLVLGFTVEKYVSICHPFQRERLCRASRRVKAVSGMALCLLGLHAVQAYFWHYSAATDTCTVRPEVTAGGVRSVWSVWSWVTEMLVFGLVPLTILALNLLVICEIKRLARTEKTRLCLSQTNTGAAATVTLLAVSFYLIFTTLPVTLCYAMFLSFPEGAAGLSDAQIQADPTWQRHFTYFAFKTIIEELGMSHYACNFFIYLATGRLFRQELCDVFLKAFMRNSHEGGVGRAACTASHAYVRASRKEANGDVSHL